MNPLLVLAIVVFGIVVIAAKRLLGLYQERLRLAKHLALANERLERANLSFVTSLPTTPEATDRRTTSRSSAVAVYARDIAIELGLREDQQRLAHMCGLVHDIGKIGLPTELLAKPAALTLAERRLMETHSEIGERILAPVWDDGEIAKVVRHHHERWDGQGYPDGLSGEDIPVMSRVIAVAGAYDAMTTDRPYQAAVPSRTARLRLAEAAGSQFDPEIVAAFEAVLASADEDYPARVRQEFVLKSARELDRM